MITRSPNDAVRFDYQFSNQGSDIKLEYSLKTVADSIPVEKVPQHLLALDRIYNVVGFELTNGTGTVVSYRRQGSSRTTELIGLLIVAIPLVVIVAIVLIRGSLTGPRRSKVAKELKAKVGFAPETAIRVADEAAIDAVLREFKCSCGRSLY